MDGGAMVGILTDLSVLMEYGDLVNLQGDDMEGNYICVRSH